MLGAAGVVAGSGIFSLAECGPFARTGDRLLVAAWMGTLTLGIAFLAASLVAPLGGATSLVVTAVLVIAALAFGQLRGALVEALRAVKPWPVVGLVALGLGVALYTSQPVVLYDTGLYHAGAIEWLSRYGSVRGVAFLEYRFGFTSSWFALAAAFNTGPLAGRVDALTGGYALLLGAIHFVVVVARIARSEGRVADWFAAIAYLVALTWLVRSGLTLSPSPDVPVIVLGIFVSWAIVVLATESGQQQKAVAGWRLPAPAVPLLLAVGALSLKPSAAPLVLATGLYYLVSCGVSRQVIGLAWLSAILVLPNVLVSLTTSGCPLFPSSVLCGHVPWSLGGVAAAADQGESRDFLRWTGAPPAGANALNWIPHWFRNEPLGTIFIAYALLASAATVPLRRITATPGAVWMIAVAVVGIAYVLAFSPAYRFMLGFVVAPPAYLGAVVCERWRLRPAVLVPAVLMAILSIALATNADPNTTHLTPSARAYSLILPMGALSLVAALLVQSVPSLPQVGLAPAALLFAVLIATRNPGLLSGLGSPPLLPSVSRDALVAHSVNDLSYFSPPEGKVCWNVIPCTTWPVLPTVRLLDPRQGIGGGISRD